MGLRRLVELFALLALAATIGGGCGTAEQDASPQRLLVAASQKLEAASTGSFRMQMTMSMQGQEIKATGVGRMDLSRNLFAMTMDMGTADKQIQMEEVVSGTTVYVRIPEAGSEWMSVDAAAMFGSDPSQQFSSDPTAALEMMADAVESIETLETTTIDGVKVTHYRAMIDMAKATGATGTDTALYEPKMPTDIWIDDQGYPRKQTMTMRFAGKLAGSQLSATMEFFNFGAPITIEVPNASSVTAIDPSKLQTS